MENKFLNRAPPGERIFKKQIRQNINYVKNLSNLKMRLRTNSVNPEIKEKYTINELRSLKLLSLGKDSDSPTPNIPSHK